MSLDEIAGQIIKDRERANGIERASRKQETNDFWTHYNHALIPEGRRAYHIDGNWLNDKRNNLALCADGPGKWLDEDIGPAERMSPKIRP